MRVGGGGKEKVIIGSVVNYVTGVDSLKFYWYLKSLLNIVRQARFIYDIGLWRSLKCLIKVESTCKSCDFYKDFFMIKLLRLLNITYISFSAVFMHFFVQKYILYLFNFKNNAMQISQCGFQCGFCWVKLASCLKFRPRTNRICQRWFFRLFWFVSYRL